MATSKTSAVIGTVERTIDSDAIRAEALRRTQREMQRTATPYERKDDGLNWARSIVARDRAGDSPGMYAVDLAMQALQEYERKRQPGDDDGDAAD
jgi:hypothetical protein